MAWRSVHYLEHPMISAFAAIACNHHVVVRTMYALACWDLTTLQAPIWSYALANDQPLGAKALLGMGGMAISHSDPADQAAPRQLIALDPATGMPIWERQIKLLISQGGLLGTANRLFLHGYDHDHRSYMLHELDPTTGETLAQARSIELRSAAVNNQALFIASPDHLSIHRLDALQESSNLLMLNTSLLADRQQVYAHILKNDGAHVMHWDATTISQRHAHIEAMPVSQVAGVFLAALPAIGQIACAFYEQGLGVWAIDIAKQTILWQSLVSEPVLVSSLTATPHAIIARTNGTASLYSINHHDGSAIPIPSHLFMSHAAFWLENQLIVTGLDEAECFVWHEEQP